MFRPLSTRQRLAAICLATLPLVASPTLAQQRLVEGIFGLGGALILNEMNQRNQPRAAPRVQVDPAAAQRAAEAREQMRLIQTRLNTLGFDAGSPDGISGPRTVRAISDFQASIGAVPNGRLTELQIATLYEQSAGIGAPAAYPPVGAFPMPPGAPQAATPSFPALGTTPTPQVAPTGAFPALGGAPTPPPDATGNFPALATAPAGAPVSAFPTIGTAPVAPPAPQAPLVAGTEKPDLVLPPPTDLSAEIKTTVFATADKQPQVLGVGLGSTGADFAAMLTENEFGNCVGAPHAQQCVRQTQTLTDTLKGWTDAEGTVWALARLIQFTEPVPADFVKNQFTETYPELMAETTGLVSSGEACAINGQAVPALAAVLDQRDDAKPEADMPEALLELAIGCPIAYSLAFNEGNGQIAAVQILFFDGTSVIRQHLAEDKARETQIGADLKF